MTKVKMIDPPSGWMYGFPKPIPEDVKNVREWLVEQGYPREVMLKYGDYFHYRCWIEEKDNADQVPDVGNKVSDHFVDVNKMILKQIDQDNPVTKGSTALVYVQDAKEEVTNSNQLTDEHKEKSEKPIIPELTDEEILNAAKDYFSQVIGATQYEVAAWVSACEWYREQLKQRQ